MTAAAAAAFFSPIRSAAYLWKTATPREREQLLRDAATPAEKALNALLAADARTASRYKFQAHICGYYADFLFRAAKLVVEVDGSAHSSGKAKQADARRTRRLNKAGYRVLRFWNGEVERDGQGVMRRIVWALVAGNPKFPSVEQATAMLNKVQAVLLEPPSLDDIIINTRVGSRRKQAAV